MRREYYGFVFEGVDLDTPILNYYFKRVSVDCFLYYRINKARRKMGFLK